MDMPKLRRTKLKQWIAENFQGVPNRFATATHYPSSALQDMLAGRKPFGERVARKLEKLAGMPPYYLERENDAEALLIASRGDRLRVLRYTKGLSVEQLASELGVSEAAVTAWETGDTGDMGADLYLRICAYFKCDPLWLAHGELPRGEPLPPRNSGAQGQGSASR